MKYIIAVLFILITIPVSAQESIYKDTTRIPDTPTGRYVMPFLDIVNNADTDQIKGFVMKNYAPSFRNQFSMEEIIGIFNYLRNTYGKLTFHSVREFQAILPDNQLMVIVQAKGTQSQMAITFQTMNEPPYQINNLKLLLKNPRIKPALLVVDIQNDYLPLMSKEDKQVALSRINECIGLFRQEGLPIIRVYHTDPQTGPAVDSEGFKFPLTIKISEDDPKVIKNFPSAFRNTDLDSILKEKGCNELFLCGLSATGCVLATYFGAIERGYNTVMVEDAVISQNHAHTKVIEQITSTTNIQDLTFLVDNIKKPIAKKE